MLEQKLIARHVLARQLGVKAATIAKWERTWFPAPVERVSDRLILYSFAEVERALAERSSRNQSRSLPRSA